MTKQISLCNLLQTAFARPAVVPPRETNPPRLSRRWEQIASGLRLQADHVFRTNCRITASLTKNKAVIKQQLSE